MTEKIQTVKEKYSKIIFLFFFAPVILILGVFVHHVFTTTNHLESFPFLVLKTVAAGLAGMVIFIYGLYWVDVKNREVDG